MSQTPNFGGRCAARCVLRVRNELQRCIKQQGEGASAGLPSGYSLTPRVPRRLGFRKLRLLVTAEFEIQPAAYDVDIRCPRMVTVPLPLAPKL